MFDVKQKKGRIKFKNYQNKQIRRPLTIKTSLSTAVFNKHSNQKNVVAYGQNK